MLGLESLENCHNPWTQAPPALAAATNLTELSLGDSWKLSLSEADTGLLLHLPRLRRLHIENTGTPVHRLWRLLRAAPQLEATETPVSAEWERQS